jgi:hypothetical protein
MSVVDEQNMNIEPLQNSTVMVKSKYSHEIAWDQAQAYVLKGCQPVSWHSLVTKQNLHAVSVKLWCCFQAMLFQNA